MISLVSILKEVYNLTPKAIIITGDRGIEKTTFFNIVEPHIPSGTKIIRNQEVPQTINSKQSFIYDTTKQSFEDIVKTIQEAQNAGYQIMVVTLYGSPIVDFLKNFDKNKKLSKNIVLNNWARIYKDIDSFSKIPNTEYLLVQTEMSPDERKKVAEFERAYKSNDLEEYFKQTISQDSGSFKSSINKKPSDIKSAEDLPDPEVLKTKKDIKEKKEKKFSDIIKDLKDQFKQVEKFLKILKPVSYKEAIGKIKDFTKP